MENIDIGSMIIVGAIVSLLVQVIKRIAGTSQWTTLLCVVVVSLLGGGVYVALKDTSFWPTFLQVLVYAGAVYTYIFRQLTKG